MTQAYDYDAVIVGGGPGGATAALYAEKMGLKVLVVDKKYFPRDKICGDALSGKAVIYLRELGLIDQIEASPQAFIDEIVFSSPNGDACTIKLKPTAHYGVSSGYVCRREVFDNVMFKAAQEKVDTIEGFTVTDLIKPNGQVKGVRGKDDRGNEREITARVVIGADGFSSVVARKLGLYDHDPKHMIVATRAYYKNVSGLNTAIELHYVEDVLPGYFWIFPLEDNLANVGIGLVHKVLKEKGIKLKDAHEKAVASDYFKERFANAELLDPGIVGWNLPVGSKRRQIHGAGYMLIGDAASLIDPFTGEGIGNAMASAKIAMETLKSLKSGNDYSEKAIDAYRKEVWARLGGELNLAYNLQRVGRFQPLINLVVNRASKRPEVADWISNMIAGTVSKKDLLKPNTYLKLVFK